MLKTIYVLFSFLVGGFGWMNQSAGQEEMLAQSKKLILFQATKSPASTELRVRYKASGKTAIVATLNQFGKGATIDGAVLSEREPKAFLVVTFDTGTSRSSAQAFFQIDLGRNLVRRLAAERDLVGSDEYRSYSLDVVGSSLALSPDGQYLAFTCSKGIVKFGPLSLARPTLNVVNATPPSGYFPRFTASGKIVLYKK